MPASPTSCAVGTALDYRPSIAHALHVVVDGLQPGREYWYRFRCGSLAEPDRAHEDRSPSRLGDRPTRYRRGVVPVVGRWLLHRSSTPRRRLARRRRLPRRLPVRARHRRERVRPPARHPLPAHLATEAHNLSRAIARGTPGTSSDADLQAAHHAAPWIATRDDHEVEDNYAAGYSGGAASPDQFAARRAAAYQAYWEHLPLRVPPPHGRLDADASAPRLWHARQHSMSSTPVSTAPIRSPGSAWQRATAAGGAAPDDARSAGSNDGWRTAWPGRRRRGTSSPSR